MLVSLSTQIIGINFVFLEYKDACMKSNRNFLFCLLLVFAACSNPPSNGTPEVTYAEAADFADSSNVSVQLLDGFRLKLWAPGPLISNAVAISIDNQGVAYVSETQRRKSSDLDIRQHRDWMVEDISLQTIEETREFHMRKMAPELSAENTWQEDFNGDSLHDYRDLEVQTEYIRRVWDSDGDGQADASALYAEGFNDMLTGVAAGVLHQDGEVYLTAAPDVYRLRDLDGDGDADEREIISHGYGIHIAYAGHDMSGLVMGPDGKVYWSIGDIGVNVVDQTGKRWAYPNQGAVMRCNPDGSDFEVFAHGLRNPQELAFDAYGNLISVDNDGDHPGEHERFVHIIQGSDTGWRINWQFGKYNNENEAYKVWMDEKLHVPHFKGQAAYILPPLALASDGPAGLAYNPGTALNDKWNGFFFSSFFKGSAAKSKIQAFRLEPKGASFQVAETQDIVSGIVSTGVAFGPDGALYLNDWKDGYAKKPEGRIWRLDVSDQAQQIRAETQSVLAGGVKGKSTAELTELMQHADMRVRMAAQFELVKQQASASLIDIAGGPGEYAPLHAIWGLGQLARNDVSIATVLLPFLKDTRPEVRAQTAKVLGDAGALSAESALVAQLKDESVRAVFFAVEALGKMGVKQALRPMVGLLAEKGDSDTHLRHAIMVAFAGLGDADALEQLSRHASVDVRLAAVVALRRMGAENVTAFLQDENPLVLEEAARAINDDLSIPEALPELAAALSRTEIQSEAFLRRAINANLRLADAASAARLVDFANTESADPAMRSDALWALGYWTAPPVLDRVDGRYRKLEPGSKSDVQTAAGPALMKWLQNSPSGLRASAAMLAGRIGYQAAEPRLMQLLGNRNGTVSVRKAALEALAALESDQLTNALNIALSDRSVELRKPAEALLATVDLPDEIRVNMLDKVLRNGTIAEQQEALAGLGAINIGASTALLDSWMDKLTAGTLESALHLDLLDAIAATNAENLLTKVSAYEAAKPRGDVLAEFSESLYGGDPRNGRKIMATDNSAQCIRCHMVQGYGGEVGPDLTHIASVLSREQLLESLINPSARLAPGYGTVILLMKDESKIVGTLEGENNQKIRVKDSSGETREIHKSDIAEREDAPSAMPGMKGILSKSAIRDLVAFLSTLE